MKDETLTANLTLTDDAQPLPDGWHLVRLGDVADVVNGFGFTETLQGKKGLPFPFIKVSDMNAEGASVTIRQAANTVDENILKTLRARTYPSGTVIFPKVGGALLTNKKRILGIEATFDNNIMGVVPKTLERAWLYYLFLTIDLKTLANTQALPSIRQSDVANLKIPLPPTIEEQRRIATVLDEQMQAVEQARLAVEEQLAAAKLLPNAFLRSVFESAEAQTWQKRKLGTEAIKIGSGITPSGGQASYERSGIPLIRSQNVHLNKFSYQGLAYISSEQDSAMELSRVFENDILLNITGASIGRVCVVPSEICPANVNQHVSIIRLNKSVCPHYLSYYLSNPEFQDFILDNQTGATRQALTKSLIEDFYIPIPATVERQTQIANRLDEQMQAVEALKQSLTARLEAIKKLPAALLRQAFAGEI